MTFKKIGKKLRSAVKVEMFVITNFSIFGKIKLILGKF